MEDYKSSCQDCNVFYPKCYCTIKKEGHNLQMMRIINETPQIILFMNNYK